MTLPGKTLVMLGLAGTGKTNFLVALDVVLDDQPDAEGLVHSGLADDRAYLQPLKEKWLRGEELKHTTRQEKPPPHQLFVRHQATNATVGFHLPDLAGESFDDYFVTRSFPVGFRDRLRDAAGLLLFLHSGQNADHAILEDPGFMDSPQSVQASASVAFDSASAWRLEDAGRQVKLVDLLQFIAEVGSREPLRIAVILSAWDLVEGSPPLGPRVNAEIPKEPAQFLALHWPLLDQFLSSHAAMFPSRAFGVSARGGGVTPGEIARLTAFERPRDRVVVVDGDSRTHDLTRPIRWLLDLPTPDASTNA